MCVYGVAESDMDEVQQEVAKMILIWCGGIEERCKINERMLHKNLGWYVHDMVLLLFLHDLPWKRYSPLTSPQWQHEKVDDTHNTRVITASML